MRWQARWWHWIDYDYTDGKQQPQQQQTLQIAIANWLVRRKCTHKKKIYEIIAFDASRSCKPRWNGLHTYMECIEWIELLSLRNDFCSGPGFTSSHLGKWVFDTFTTGSRLPSPKQIIKIEICKMQHVYMFTQIEPTKFSRLCWYLTQENSSMCMCEPWVMCFKCGTWWGNFNFIAFNSHLRFSVKTQRCNMQCIRFSTLLMRHPSRHRHMKMR